VRILQVCHHYYPSAGGVAAHVKNISERLARRHDLTVFTADAIGWTPREEEINGVAVRRFRCFAPNGLYHFSLEMLREVRRSHFDVVHGHNYHSFPFLCSRYARGDRHVVTPHYHRHGITPLRETLNRLYRPVGRGVFHRADRTIAVSSYEKDLLMEDFRLQSDEVTVIPNGVNLEEFGSLQRHNGDRKTILCVARLVEFKGVQYAVRALPLLDESVCLEIVGSGPYREKLEELAATLGVNRRITYYPKLYGKDYVDRVANADLFMLLSKYEAMSIALAEAMAARIPCVVANTSGLREWVDNRNCFGIDYPIDCGRLAGLAGDLLGREVPGVRIWDWDEVAEETAKIYEE
jgi:glycosyltransferase involved in cell wall biosynthesis